MKQVQYITNANFFECKSGRVESHRSTLEPNADWLLTLYKPYNQLVQIQFQPPNRYTIFLFNWNNSLVIPPLHFQDAYTKIKHYLTLKTFL